MKRLMIVDDELFVRVGVKSILDWESHGYSFVCEASNGQEAMAKIQEHHPDIVLTDLMMDRMDGFALIEQCAQTFPQMRFIILSSYNDFENVRHAMQLGAADYIFKLTAKPEEMLRTLDMVSEKMDHERPREERADALLLKNISVIKTRLIKLAIQQSYLSEEELVSEFANLRLSTDFSLPCISFYTSIDSFYRKRKTGEFPELTLLKFAMENIIQEVQDRTHHAETYNYDGGDLITLIHLSQGEHYGDFCKQAQENQATILEYFKRYLGVEVTAALSLPFTGVGGIKAAVKQNLAALDSRFLSGEGRLYLWEAATETKTPLPPIPCDTKTLEMALRDGDFERTRTYLREFTEACMGCEPCQTKRIRLEFLELYQRLRTWARTRHLPFDTLKDDYGMTLYEAVTRYDLCTSIRDSFLAILGRCEQSDRPGDPPKCRPEIQMVRQYVQLNLATELHVQAAARLANMSESYFSHTFKSETGLSFVNYVNRMRVERATTLLQETDLRVAEVALEVGIDNPNYFSVLYKKTTGKSPNEVKS